MSVPSVLLGEFEFEVFQGVTLDVVLIVTQIQGDSVFEVCLHVESWGLLAPDTDCGYGKS